MFIGLLITENCGEFDLTLSLFTVVFFFNHLFVWYGKISWFCIYAFYIVLPNCNSLLQLHLFQYIISRFEINLNLLPVCWIERVEALWWIMAQLKNSWIMFSLCSLSTDMYSSMSTIALNRRDGTLWCGKPKQNVILSTVVNIF